MPTTIQLNWLTEITEIGFYWAYENLDPTDADLILIEVYKEDNLLKIRSFYDNGESFFDFNDFIAFKKIDKPDYEEINNLNIK